MVTGMPAFCTVYPGVLQYKDASKHYNNTFRENKVVINMNNVMFLLTLVTTVILPIPDNNKLFYYVMYNY